MSVFEYRNGELFAEAVPLAEIAEQFGTPTYVYSRQYLEQQFLAYRNALGDRPHLICYAVKANSNIAVLNVLARLGAGFDIVSQGELERVLVAGGAPENIVFSGVGKTVTEMQRALDVGIHCFNLESEAELERLQAVAEAMGKVAPVSVRVNPDVDAKTHPYISTGLKENKFGIDIARVPDVYRRAQAMSHIDVMGVDCHIGSQLTDVAPYLEAMDRLFTLIDTLEAEGIRIRHLDLGGGLGVRYTNEQPPSPGEFIQGILDHMGDRQIALAFEPGRSITANAGTLLTRVEYLKPGPHKNFALIDAAMNDMIRPALYQAYLNIDPVKPHTQGEEKTWDLVGPVCETGDFLGKDRRLALQAGDLLAVASAGAYGFTMSSNYNSRGRAAEIMVDGEHCHLIRERETIADLMHGEHLLPG